MQVVDGPLPFGMRRLLELTIGMLVRFGGVVIFSPVFIIPGAVVALLGGFLGQLYMRAQLYVKREMSNAKSPVLGQ